MFCQPTLSRKYPFSLKTGVWRKETGITIQKLTLPHSHSVSVNYWKRGLTAAAPRRIIASKRLFFHFKNQFGISMKNCCWYVNWRCSSSSHFFVPLPFSLSWCLFCSQVLYERRLKKFSRIFFIISQKVSRIIPFLIFHERFCLLQHASVCLLFYNAGESSVLNIFNIRLTWWHFV